MRLRVGRFFLCGGIVEISGNIGRILPFGPVTICILAMAASVEVFGRRHGQRGDVQAAVCSAPSRTAPAASLLYGFRVGSTPGEMPN